MSGDIRPYFQTVSALTWTLAGLATSSGLTTGQEATQVVTAATGNQLGCIEAKVNIKVTLGTSPTAGQLVIYAVPLMEGFAAYPDAFTGSNNARTVRSVDSLATYGRLLMQFNMPATSGYTQEFPELSIAKAFDGIVPRTFTLFMAHNLVVALASGSGYVTQIYGNVT
jgi:hypothetical protein